MTQIDWSKAQAHATHWCPGNARIEAGWIYAPGGNNGEFYSCYSEKGLEHIPIFPEWRKGRLVPRPVEAAAEWNGENLPPIGSAVELVLEKTVKFEDYDHGIHCVVDTWKSGDLLEVIAHRDVHGKPCAIVFNTRAMNASAVIAKMYRPIRTAEQIAADEREEAIEQMILVDEKGSLSRTYFCGLLYDAGYRKQVTP